MSTDLVRTVNGQATVVAFDTAFNAVALLFVAAVPVLVAIKIALSRRAHSRPTMLAGSLP